LETVVDNLTGYLVKPDAQEFADAMLNLISNQNKQKSYGNMARKRVIENFSFSAFTIKLNNILLGLKDVDNYEKKID
jgi:glycosyltransferase involved in cell wall biosynthesis